MRMSRNLPVFGVAVMLASAIVTGQGPAPAAASSPRTVYVTVTDKNGLPVEDLTAGELDVKEGGKAVEVVQVGIAKAQMQIAIIVDDNGTGLFRSGLARFVQRLEGHAVMSLRSVVGQTMKLVDFTASVDTLFQGIATLNARPGTPDGGQLLEQRRRVGHPSAHQGIERPFAQGIECRSVDGRGHIGYNRFRQKSHESSEY